MYRKSFSRLVTEAINNGYKEGIQLFVESVYESLDNMYLLNEENLNEKISLLMMEADMPDDSKLSGKANASTNDFRKGVTDAEEEGIENIDEKKIDEEMQKIMSELEMD